MNRTSDGRRASIRHVAGVAFGFCGLMMLAVLCFGTAVYAAPFDPEEDLRQRAADNASWLGDIPDYELRLYRRVTQISRRIDDVNQEMVVGVLAVTIAVSGLMIWAGWRLRPHRIERLRKEYLPLCDIDEAAIRLVGERQRELEGYIVETARILVKGAKGTKGTDDERAAMMAATTRLEARLFQSAPERKGEPQ